MNSTAAGFQYGGRSALRASLRKTAKLICRGGLFVYNAVIPEEIMNETVRATICGEIATVMFNRPKAYNCFDLETISIFAEHLINLAGDSTVRGIIISGEGDAFCAGGDLKWVYGWPEGYASAFHKLAAYYHQSILEIRRMRKPVIAAINGVAAGGGFSLALACDFRIMEKSAGLVQAYTSSGLSIDGGGSFILPKLVGMARSLEIAAFDRPISADLAKKWGLVTKVVEDGKSLDEAMIMAEVLAQRAVESFARAKQLFTDSFSNSFETHLELERAALEAAAASPEGAEGLTAFFEKRKPVFD
jgi:2-(1,2-epoxy-1,2-dihydrophenyl)acetyl-CoA isomerase